MTTEQIVKSLRACGCGRCDDCACIQENVSCKEKNLEAADLIKQQAAKIKELEEKIPRWISVDDRLPEEKVNCIVHYKHAYCDNDDYWAIGICFYDGEKFQMDLSYKVTHWMPLPEPPETDGGGKDG